MSNLNTQNIIYPTTTTINDMIAAANKPCKAKFYQDTIKNLKCELIDIRSSVLYEMYQPTRYDVIKMKGETSKSRSFDGDNILLLDINNKLSSPKIFIDFKADIVENIEVTISCDTDIDNIIIRKLGSSGLRYPTTTCTYSTSTFDPAFIADCITHAVNDIRNGIISYHNLQA